MTVKQKAILLFLAGILFLALTMFREEWFVRSTAGLWLYRTLAMAGLLLSAASIGRFLGKKWMLLFPLLMVLSEMGFAALFWLVKSGRSLPPPVTAFLGYIYLFHCRDYIVYDEQRGRYDGELFYTLRPGVFRYDNMEFSTTYRVNPAGFRGDDSSLSFPEIIFLGDSYTMGWGVEQEESYPAVLGKLLGKKSLNLGVASYGTAREYLAFQRAQRDSCRLVVLQYCPNDAVENRAFVENGFRLPVSPEEKFRAEILWNKLYQVYFPLKYTHSAVYFFAKKCAPSTNAASNNDGQPSSNVSDKALSDFFVILEKIRTSFDGPVVVFNLGMDITTSEVNDRFSAWLAENPMPGVHVFPSSQFLEKEDYLPLDTHLKKSGNQKLAEGLKVFILEKKLLE